MDLCDKESRIIVVFKGALKIAAGFGVSRDILVISPVVDLWRNAGRPRIRGTRGYY